MMDNIINEIRLKINITMAGDYGLDEDDVKLTLKMNEMNSKKIDSDLLTSRRMSYEDRMEFERVNRILMEDFSFIKDKYWNIYI